MVRGSRPEARGSEEPDEGRGWQAGWTWHSLRHWFCTALLASGALDTDVALCAGHRDSTTTRAMYVDPTRGATQRLNAILA